MVGYIATFCAPSCIIPISIMFHSVRLVMDITAILSLGSTPSLRSALLIAFALSRYSLVEVKPETGRMHQIRRHLSHIFHPIIADRPHGCNKQNRFFLQQYAMNTMMLHASVLTFDHPNTKERITIKATWHDEFDRMKRELGLVQALH